MKRVKEKVKSWTDKHVRNKIKKQETQNTFGKYYEEKIETISYQRVFLEHFRNLKLNNEDGEQLDVMENISPDAKKLNMLNDPVTENEVMTFITKLKTNKTPGYNHVHEEYFIYTTNMILILYVIMFNEILDSGQLPDKCLVSTIIPLYKNKGYVHDPHNYRELHC